MLRKVDRLTRRYINGLRRRGMDRKLRIRISGKAKYRLMSLSGAFDSSSMGSFRAQLAGFFSDAVLHNEVNVVIDLSGLTFTGLDFVNEICSKLPQLDKTRLKLSIITPDRANSELFEVTGLSSLYPVYETEESFIIDRIGATL